MSGIYTRCDMVILKAAVLTCMFSVKVDVNKVREEWLTESMPEHVCKIASHYGIYRDLFDGAHFHPLVPLDISFDYDEEFVTPVRYGNVIPAAEV